MRNQRHLAAQLICAFVFAYLKCRFYHDAANWFIYHVRNKNNDDMSNDFQFCNTIMLLKIYEPRYEKPVFCICENKDADQLRGNREADQRLCFSYTDSTIPLLPKTKLQAS